MEPTKELLLQFGQRKRLVQKQNALLMDIARRAALELPVEAFEQIGLELEALVEELRSQIRAIRPRGTPQGNPVPVNNTIAGEDPAPRTGCGWHCDWWWCEKLKEITECAMESAAPACE